MNNVKKTARKILDILSGKTRKMKKLRRSIGFGFIDWALEYFGIIEDEYNHFVKESDKIVSINIKSAYRSYREYFSLKGDISIGIFKRKLSMFQELTNIYLILY